MSEKAQIIEQLQTLKEVVTPEDKQAATKNIPISRPTLDLYLKGDIVKIGTALSITNHFSKVLSARFQKLRETNLI